MTIHDAINEYLKQCEARKLSWSTLKAYRCDLEILDRSQRHTELLIARSDMASIVDSLVLNRKNSKK